MSDWTEINWTDRTFNAWVGCTKVSEACANCYAWQQADVLGRAANWSKRPGLKVWGPTAERYFPGDDYWSAPAKWNRDATRAGVRVKVFSNDMADLFERYEGDAEIARKMDGARARLWKTIEETPNLDWQLLTKRPENVRSMVPWGAEWPANVWLGCTVETQERAVERIPHLIELPAAVRFLSVEPMLSAIDLSPWSGLVDWVICGAESISKKRPTTIEHIRQLRDQCLRDGIAFWFKQWGVHQPPRPVGDTVRMQVPTLGKVGFKKFAVLDGRVWNQLPVYRWKRAGQVRTRFDRLDFFEMDDPKGDHASEASAITLIPVEGSSSRTS